MEVASGSAGPPLTSTTISTIAVQTGRTRIVLAVLKHKNELHLRVQEMEPGIVDFGRTLEEALELEKEHNECLAKLLAKQPNVEELLAQADELISTQQPKREVYGAMADSLGQAWRDLNDLLEYRRLLLERAVVFHRLTSDCNQKITEAQKEMEKDMSSYQDKGSARDWLQEHQNIRKDILEASMKVLGESQGLLELINDLHRLPAADSRGYPHATSAACHIVEDLLENIHDRRKRLEELWQRRRQALLTHQQLLSLRDGMDNLRRMFQELLALDSKFNTLGNSLEETRKFIQDHSQFEVHVKELYDFSQQLRRLHTQIAPCPTDVDRDFKQLEDQIEKWYLHVDRRRFVLTITEEFYERVETVKKQIKLTIKALDDMEGQKEQISPQELADRQKELLDDVKSVIAPLFHEGQMLLERVENMNSNGVEGALKDVKQALHDLVARCTSFQAVMAKRSESYRKFTELYTTLFEWTVHVVEVILKTHQVLSPSLSGAKDFVDVHEQLFDEMQSRELALTSFMSLVKDMLNNPAGLSDNEVREISQKSEDLGRRWNDISKILTSRLDIVLPYSDFQKHKTKVSAEVEVLRNLSKSVRENPSSDLYSSSLEQRMSLIQEQITGMQARATDFMKQSSQADAAQLDVSQAVVAVNDALAKLQQDMKNFATVTQLSNTLRQRKQEWQQIIEETHRTVTLIIRTEREVLEGLQLGYLGSNLEEAKQLQSKVTAFEPIVSEIRVKVELLLKSAKDAPVDTETATDREMVVNDLTKAYERFVHRIEEYKVLLNMAVQFYEHTQELQQLMQEYEKLARTPPPAGSKKADELIQRHVDQREHISRVYEEIIHHGNTIVNRIRQNFPQSVDMDTFSKNIMEQRDNWERMWKERNSDLQIEVDVTNIKREAEEIQKKILELSEQLNRRKDEVGESLQGARCIHEVHSVFTKTMELVSTKIHQFVSRIEVFIQKPENAAQFSDLRSVKDNVEKMWSSFNRDVGILTKRTELAVHFYELLEEAEKWYKDTTQTLVTIGRKTTECKSSDDVNNVLTQMENFLKPGEQKQQDRVKQLTELSLQVFGSQGPQRVEYLASKNKDVIDSFHVISNELFSIAENLHAKTVKQTRAKSDEDSQIGQPPLKAAKMESREIPLLIEQPLQSPPVPQKVQLVPASFTENLSNAQSSVGQPVVLHAKVVGTPTPVVRWFRDGMPISNNPDYVIRTDTQTGETTLTINEAFVEDSGQFSCSAENSGGLAVSECILHVAEIHEPVVEMSPPIFLRTPQDAVAIEGTGLQFECQVAGSPRPLIVWCKNGQELVPRQSKYLVFPPDDEGVTKLLIPNANIDDQGIYECKATNLRGVATCSIAFHTQGKGGEEPPFFTKLLAPTIAQPGEMTKLECHLIGNPQPELEWTHNGTVIHDSRNRVLKFDGKIATLVIFEFSPQNAGLYVCSAKNKLGEATTTCTLDVISSETKSKKSPGPVVSPTVVRDVPEQKVEEHKPAVPVTTPKHEFLYFKPEFDRPWPLHLEVVEIEPIKLEVVVRSAPEAQIQWMKNGEIVDNSRAVFESYPISTSPPADFHSLFIKNPVSADSGRYTFAARNTEGETSIACNVKVNPSPKTPPAIAPKPAKPQFPRELPPQLTVDSSSELRLETVIKSVVEPQVQWLKNGNILTADVRIRIGKEPIQHIGDLVEDRHYLIITNPTVEDSGNYVCRASSYEGEVVSSCSVVVNEVHTASTPEILPKLIATTATEENRDLIQASVVPAKPVVPPKPVNVLEQKEVIRVEETNVIQSEGPPFDTEPPRFSELLVDQSVEEGHPLRLKCHVSGSKPLEIKWFKDDVEIPEHVDYRTVYNESTGECMLEIPEVFAEDAGVFQIQAVNQAGIGKCYCNLKVADLIGSVVNVPDVKPAEKRYQTPPQFVQLFRDSVVVEGKPTLLECVIGGPDTTVTWYKDSVLLNPSEYNIQTQSQRHILQIPHTRLQDAGRYVCQAENLQGKATCSAQLTVTEERPQFAPAELIFARSVPEQFPSMKVIDIIETTETITHSAAERQWEPVASIGPSVVPVGPKKWAPPPQSVPDKTFSKIEQNIVLDQFLQTDKPMSPAKLNLGAEPFEHKPRGPLTLYSALPHERGYVPFGEEPSGTTEIFTHLSDGPTVPPTFPLKLLSNGVKPGEKVVFQARVQGSPIPNVTWFREDTPLQNSLIHQIFQQGDLHQLVIPQAFPADAGRYKIRAVNPAGEGICIAELVILEPNQCLKTSEAEELLTTCPISHPLPVQKGGAPNFVKTLQQLHVSERHRVLFECAVDASPPITVKWYRNNIEIKPSPDYQQKQKNGVCSLIIPEVYPEDSGTYSCRVTNDLGSRHSSAVLTVEPSFDAGSKIAPAVLPKHSQSQPPHFAEDIRPKKPKIQSSNISYRNAVSDHSDIELGDVGVYSPLSQCPPLSRPLYVRDTSSGSEFVPDSVEKRLLAEVEYRESLYQTTELPAKPNMNGYVQGLGMEPPRFLQVIAPAAVAEGGEVQLHARVTGNPKPVISWLKNGQRLPVTSHRHFYYQENENIGVSIRMCLKEDSGNYTVIAQNAAGQDACSATITVEDTKFRRSLSRTNSQPDMNRTVPLKPRDTSSGLRRAPEEETYDKSLAPRFLVIPNEVYTKEGSLVRLDCRVSGRPYPDVAWSKNGIQIQDDYTHKLVVNESGNHSLMILHAMIEDSGRYTCVATNISGEAQFNVNVTVEESDKVTAPSFVQKLVNRQLKEGESVTLQARAVGMPAPTITWHKGAREIFPVDNIYIDTKNGTSTLTIENANQGDSDWYQCNARNSAGTSSTKAKVTVEALPRDLTIPGGFFVPRVSRRQEASIPEPEKVHLRPTYRAAAAPSYPFVAPMEVLNEKPAFTSLLNDLELYEGDRARFESCLIPIGDGTLRVEWYKNGHLVQSDSRHISGNNFGFISLDILNLQVADSGVYTCRAINSVGEAVTTATLRCYPRQQQQPSNFQVSTSTMPVIPPQPRSIGPPVSPKPKFAKGLRDIEAKEGAVAILEVQIEPTDDQLMKVEWYRNNQAIQMSERFDMKFLFGRAVLTIKHCRADDSGVYTVRAHNGAGDVKSTATLHVEPEKPTPRFPVYSTPTYTNGLSSGEQRVSQYDQFCKGPQTQTSSRTIQSYSSSTSIVPTIPTFMKHLEPNYNVLEGSRLHMEVRSEPAGNDLEFTWMKNGQPIESDHRIRTSFAEGYAAIDILTVYPEDSGVYTLRVRNAAGEAFTSTNLHCIAAPQPQPELQKYPSSESTITYNRQTSTTSSASANIQPVTSGQAPVFTQSLQNVLTKQGGQVNLDTRLIPIGDSTLTVLWYKDGQPLQTGARFKTVNDWGHVTLEILHSLPEDSGVYTCRAVNSCGEAAVNGTVSVQADKSIVYESSTAANLDNIKQLEDWRNRDTNRKEVTMKIFPPKLLKPLHPSFTVTETKSAHFECQIQPADGIQVEWYLNGVPVKASSRIRTVCDFGYVALDIIGVRPDDVGEWTCVIKNKAGQIDSRTNLSVIAEASMILGTENPERLSEIQRLEDRTVRSAREVRPVVERPQFRTPLHNAVNLLEGSSVHLECRVTPTNEPTQKIEWFHNGTELLNSSRIKTVNDFGFVALDISNLHPGDSGHYLVRASNAAGEASQSCEILVLSEAGILNQPINVQSLSEIQRLEDVKGPYQVQDIVQATQPPRFLNQIKNLDIPEDQDAHFECRLEPLNDSKLRVEWYKNGEPLRAKNKIKTTYDFGYVSLHIVGAQEEDAGVYTVLAYNQLGRVDQSATLNVRGNRGISFESQNPEGLQKIQQLEAWRNASLREPIAHEAPSVAPRFAQQLRCHPSQLTEGQVAHFEARLENVDSKTHVEWLHNKRPLTSASRSKFVNDFGYVALTIADLRAEDSGEYLVRAYNDRGEDVSATSINIQAKKSLLTESLHVSSLGKIQALEHFEPHRPPEIHEGPIQRPMFTSPLRNLELVEGDKAHLETRLIPVGCTVKWLHNGQEVNSGSRFLVTNDFGFVALDVNHLRPDDSGTYTCCASNELGEAIATCSILVRGTNSMILESAHPEALSKLQALESCTQEKSEEVETKFGHPVFTIPLPASLEVQEGEPVRLHGQVLPIGDATLKIEWFRNQMPLRTGSRFIHVNEFGHIGLDFSAATEEDSGLYTVRAKNAAGEAVSSTAVRCLSKASLLTGTLHPESLPRIQQLETIPYIPSQEIQINYGSPRFVAPLNNEDNVKEGGLAHFECRLEPSSDPTLKVEWFLNGVSLPAQNRAKLVQDFGFVALDLNYVTENDAGVYMVRAYNKHGEAFTSGRLHCLGTHGIVSNTQTSDLALQRIAQLENAQNVTFTSQSKLLGPEGDFGIAPKFTSAPKDLVLKENDVAHAHCNVTPTTDPNMQIVWFKNGQQLVASSRLKTMNEFGFIVLEISGIRTDDAGQYVCIARNQYGEDRVSFTIQCTGKRSILLDTQHPESLEKIRRLEEPGDHQLPQILDKPKQIPKILQPLRPVIVNERAPAHFETRITPTDDVDMLVEWFINGRPIRAGHRIKTVNDFGFVALDILDVRLEEFGTIAVRVRNSLGVDETSTTLSQAGLGPKQCPRFTSSIKDVSGVKEGESIHLEANIEPTNDPNLHVDWYWNNKPIIQGSRVKTIHDFGYVVLEISPVYGEDSGTYSAVARNEVGEAVTSCNVRVESKKGLIFDSQLPAEMRDSSMQHIQQLESASMQTYIRDSGPIAPTSAPRFVSSARDLDINEGTIAHFELRVEPSNDNTLRVDWFHNGKPIDVGSRITRINDFGFIILEITGVQGRDAGTYTCVARNALAEARSDVQLRVQTSKNIIFDSSQPASLKKLQELETAMESAHVQPVIEEQPDSPPRFTSQLEHHFDLIEGDTAHLEVKVEPTNALIEWFRNGRPIITGSRIRSVNDFGFVVLEINGVTAEDSGKYSCRAKTSVGVTESSTDVRVQSKKSLILDSQIGGEAMLKLQELEMPSAPQREEPPVVKQAPKFITQLAQNVQASEGNTIHIDCRVQPMDCVIEWYHNGRPIQQGHRFKMVNDFGYVALDILWAYAENSGEYVARAVNELGEDVTRSIVIISAKESVITKSQLPEGMEKGVERLEEIERDLSTRGPIPFEAPDNRKQRSKPEFTVKPRPVEVQEGEPAKFECKVVGYPRPRISWMLNGQLVITGPHFKITFDGLINTMEIPRTRQYDTGEITVIAQNAEGSATTTTTLTVTTKSDYRTVLKHTTSSSKSVPVPDAFQARLEKTQQDGVQQVELQSIRRQTSQTSGAPQLVKQASADITIDISRQQQTVSNQWQQQQQETASNQWQFQQQPPVAPQAPYVAPKPTFNQYQPPSPHISQPPPISIKPFLPPQQETQFSRETVSTTQTSTTQQQQQAPVQQQAPKPEPQPSAKPPGATPAWLRKQQEVEQPSWVSSKKTPSVTAHALKPQSPSINVTSSDQQMVDISQQQTIGVTRKRQVQGQTQSSQLPIPTGSEDMEMSASESEYTQRLQKGNVTEIRYVQQREKSESKRQSVQKVVAAGQGPLPADLQAPKFVQRLEPCRVSEGKSAQFICRFTGKPTPRIEWYRENFQISNSPDFQINTTKDMSVLFIPEVYLEDSGNFTVKAINDGGMSQSTANLIVEEAYSGESSGPTPPSFSDTIHDTKAKQGDTVKLEARVHGSLPISITWFKNGQKLQPNPRLKNVRDAELHQLVIQAAISDDSGWYDCVAVNEGGEARCSGQLIIEAPDQQVPAAPAAIHRPTGAQLVRPQVTQEPQDVSVYEGESATFRANIIGTPQPEVRWFKGQNAIKNSKYFRTFVSGNVCTLVITEAFHEDEGEYRCLARNPAGEVQCSASLKVLGGDVVSTSSSGVRILTYQSQQLHSMVVTNLSNTGTEN